MAHTSSTKGAFALIGAAVTYSSFGLLIREMAHMFGNNAQVAFRFLFALIFLSLFLIIFKRAKKLPLAAAIRASALGIAFCSTILLFTVAIVHTTIANTIFVFYAGSIITSLLIGTFAFKEKLTPTKIVAITLTFIGLAMYGGALVALSVGVITAVASGIFDGFGNGIRKTLKGYDRNSVLLYQFGAGTVMSMLAVAISGEQAVTAVSFWPVAAGLIFALLQIGLGNLLLYGFQHFDVNVGTVILATELFFATLMGLIFFGEVPLPNELLGGIVIFIASILSAVDLKALSGRLRIAK